jgi:hypothetical protein
MLLYILLGLIAVGLSPVWLPGLVLVLLTVARAISFVVFLPFSLIDKQRRAKLREQRKSNYRQF